MSARDNILARLRKGSAVPFAHENPLEDRWARWQQRQPPLGDLTEAFIKGVEGVGGNVLRVPDWQALPATIGPWLAEFNVHSVMTGSAPRLEPVREALAATGILELRRYDRTLKEQQHELFNTDCGITTSHAAIAETGSVVLIPSPEEPRLLSLAMPLHLVVVEASTLMPTLADFISRGDYQARMPSNLVVVTGASRTADIELVLAMGVHGPRHYLVALVG